MSSLNTFKNNLTRRFPLLGQMQKWAYRLKPYSMKFTTYYEKNGWNNGESKSGNGSTLKATTEIRKAIPKILEQYKIQSMLDAPCGDFHWMKEINLEGVAYTGMDIVKKLIEDNRREFSSDNIHFEQGDIIKDSIPKFDLIMTRDCFFHLTNNMILSAVKNLKESGSTYFFTTTFPDLQENQEIYSAGLFRPINLELPPYSFPKPILMMDEKMEGRFMGLWKFSELHNS